jgi:hypothetical protein
MTSCLLNNLTQKLSQFIVRTLYNKLITYFSQLLYPFSVQGWLCILHNSGELSLASMKYHLYLPPPPSPPTVRPTLSPPVENTTLF